MASKKKLSVGFHDRSKPALNYGPGMPLKIQPPRAARQKLRLDGTKK